MANRSSESLVRDSATQAQPNGVNPEAYEDSILGLWEASELSTRAAAAKLGLEYHEFLDLLDRKGIPVESGPFDAAAVDEFVRRNARRP